MWYTLNTMTAQEQAVKDLDERWCKHWHRCLKSTNGAFYDTEVINEFSASGDKLILARMGRDGEEGERWCHESLFKVTKDGTVKKMMEDPSRSFKDHTGYPYDLMYEDAVFQEEYEDEDGRQRTRTIPCVVLRNGEGLDITIVLPHTTFYKQYFCDGCQKDVALFEEDKNYVVA